MKPAVCPGVHCKTNIPDDTLIMRIPQQYLITVEMGKDTPIGRKMVQGKYVHMCVSLRMIMEMLIVAWM